MAEYTKTGHRARHRERYLKSGFDSFTERDKLELLLFYASPRKDTKQTAHNLLEKFGSIKAILDATFDELKEVKDIGDNAAVLIKLLPEIMKEYMNSEKTAASLDTTDKVCSFFSTKFSGCTDEKIIIACLDDKLKLIEYTTIAEGTPGSVYLDIRKLIKYTYSKNSENIIISHNHPNGDTLPSDDDIKMTSEIYKRLKPIGINLLDHVIVADDHAQSLRDLGAFGVLK